jgi:hypothetical protein
VVRNFPNLEILVFIAPLSAGQSFSSVFKGEELFSSRQKTVFV